MSIITLKTIIAAPVEICFDLARSIDLHINSMHTSNEKAIAGKTTGLIELDETVTWSATHFGIPFKMTMKISSITKPKVFVDEMLSGPFTKLHHQHIFTSIGIKTEMTDVFEFEAPFGIFGRMADKFFLKNYMTILITKRNEFIKEQAETCS